MDNKKSKVLSVIASGAWKSLSCCTVAKRGCHAIARNDDLRTLAVIGSLWSVKS